jgi:predicted glycosyltransferase
VRVWIDVDNAPHVQVFRPIIAELKKRGADVDVTARNRTFVPELLHAAGIEHHVIGEGQPRGGVAKAAALARRTASLLRFAPRGRFDVAMGHGSRSLPPAARLAGIPNLTMFDYEHVSTWLFRSFCDRILVPKAVAASMDGAATGGPWREFDGFKEELYLAEFTPDPGVRAQLGVRDSEVLVVIRPPSRTAHYHDAASEGTLEALARRIAAASDVRAVWLRRDRSEPVPDFARAANILVPEEPLDGLSLLAAADVAVSGGGTMNREAALLGTPAYSIFTGPVGALDRELIRRGRLILIGDPAGVPSIRLQKKRAATSARFDGRLCGFVVDHIWDLGTRASRAGERGRKRWAFPS